MRTLIAVVAAGLLTLAACGAETGSDSSTGPGENAIGKSDVYEFDGTTLEGESFDGAQLEGKPAVLWFWAPWCPTCRAQIPNLTQLANNYDGEVAVVGVGGQDSEDAIRDIAADIPHLTHLIDDEGQVWSHFEVTAQSTYTVIGADGEIESHGYLDDQELNDLVEQLAD